MVREPRCTVLPSRVPLRLRREDRVRPSVIGSEGCAVTCIHEHGPESVSGDKRQQLIERPSAPRVRSAKDGGCLRLVVLRRYPQEGGSGVSEEFCQGVVLRARIAAFVIVGQQHILATGTDDGGRELIQA